MNIDVIIGFGTGCMVGGLFGFLMAAVMTSSSTYDKLSDKSESDLVKEYNDDEGI